MNNWNGIGRLTKDLELRTSPNGNKYVFFRVAINNTRKSGEEQADFVPCVAYGKVAENMTTYLVKGSKVGITGRISTSVFEKEGQKMSSTVVSANRVEFLDSKNKDKNDAIKASNDIINGYESEEAPSVPDEAANDSVLWD